MNIKDLPAGSYTPVTPKLNINSLPKDSYTLVTTPSKPNQPIDTTAPGMNIPQINAPFQSNAGDGAVSTVAKTVGNIPTDFANFITGAINTLNPINIGKNLSDIITQTAQYASDTNQSPLGVIGKAMIGDLKEASKPGAVLPIYKSAVQVIIPKFFQQLATGDVQGALKTNTENPVQTWAPLLLLAKAGADHAGMGEQFDNAVKTITEPVTKTASVVLDAAGKVLNKGASEAAGFTTGQGAPVINEAFKSGQDIANNGENTAFNEAMRGKNSPQDLVDTAVQAAQKVADSRGTQYVEQMKSLGLDTKQIDTTPIQTALDSNLKKFNVTINEDGSLNFDNSPIRNKPAAVGDIKTVYEDVTRTLKNSGDAVSIDALKKSTSQVYEGTSPARAFVADMGNEIGKTLKEQVPGYEKMTAGYAQASGFLKELKQATGISQVEGKVNYNSALSKLSSAMRQNNEFRLSVIKELQNQAGVDITGKIAGTSSSSLLPRGLVAKIMAGGGIEATVLHLINPATLSSLLLASPRVVGEFVQALGFSEAKTASFLKMLNEMKTLTSPATAIQNNKK